MSMDTFPVRLLFLGMMVCGLASAQDGFALHDGDRVAFYGDSITAQHLYTRYVEDFVLTRYPKLNVMFYNAGLGGDQVRGAARLERDVFPLNPTVVTIMLGMNDGGYRPEDPATMKKYEDGYRAMVKTVKAHLSAARIYLIQPSPYDEVAHTDGVAGYNNVLRHFGAILQQIAKDENVQVIDANAPMVAELTKAKELNAGQASQIIPDKIHPSSIGHWVLAEAIVKAWHITPVISAVTVDAAAKKAVGLRANVSSVETHDGTLEWRETDEALPLPLDTVKDSGSRFLFDVSDIASMDREMLTVTGLTGAKYRLVIDAIDSGIYSASELATGVNLATKGTPMVAQSVNVERVNQDRVNVDGVRYQLVAQGKDVKDQMAGVKVLADFDESMWREQKKRATPAQRVFHLVPVTDAP